MKTNLIALLLVAAVTVLIFSASLAGLHLYSRRAPPPTVEVMVAARDIREGEKLLSVHLQAKIIDARASLESMMKAGEENAFMGYLAVADIKAGDPIFKSLLTLPMSDCWRLQAAITTGMRAISIPVDYFASVSRAIEPGDRVDLLVHLESFAPCESDKMYGIGDEVPIMAEILEPVSIYLFQDVKVLATGEVRKSGLKTTSAAGEGYRSVTLELTPDEVSVVAFALHASRTDNPEGPGPFTLVLRNPQDDGYLEKVQVTRYESLIDLANLEALHQKSLSSRREKACFGDGMIRTR